MARVPEGREQVRAGLRSERRLAHRLEDRPWVTWALLGVLWGIHFALGFVPRPRVPVLLRFFGARGEGLMLRFGARRAAEVEDGETWRLVTYGFLHWDLGHLAMNSFALWGLGRLCQSVFGPVRFLAIFLASVVGGGVLSQMGSPATVSAGASGGVFGLLGALVAYGARRAAWMSPELRTLFGRKLWPWIVANLAIGFALPFVDNRAHIGGLLTGALFGVLSADEITDNNLPRPVVTGALVVAQVGVVVWAAVRLFGA